MKEKTKHNIKHIFGSLIKNDSAIECAKTIAGWIPVAIAVVIAFLPVIPLTVNVANTYGSKFLKSQTYNFELYNTDAFLGMSADNVEFKVNDNNQLLKYVDGEYEATAHLDDVKPLYTRNYTNSKGEESIAFEFYYSERTNSGKDDDNISALVNLINSTTYLTGTTLARGTAEEEAKEAEKQNETEKKITFTYYRPTYVIFYKDGIRIYVNNLSTSKGIINQGGDWKKTEKNVDLVKRFLTVENYNLADLYEVDNFGDYKILKNTEYTTSVQKNINKVYDETFQTAKQRSLVSYTLIFYGVYIVLIAFMGLMIFLLTRGKKNPMNYMTFWLSTKIACWASITPALLALILGFLMTNFATMFFIIFYGIRIMWLSMRQLRPAY